MEETTRLCWEKGLGKERSPLEEKRLRKSQGMQITEAEPERGGDGELK